MCMQATQAGGLMADGRQRLRLPAVDEIGDGGGKQQVFRILKSRQQPECVDAAWLVIPQHVRRVHGFDLRQPTRLACQQIAQGLGFGAHLGNAIVLTDCA